MQNVKPFFGGEAAPWATPERGGARVLRGRPVLACNGQELNEGLVGKLVCPEGGLMEIVVGVTRKRQDGGICKKEKNRESERGRSKKGPRG